MSKNPLYILYGSATGNAEHIAKDLAASALTSCPAAASIFDSVVCCELDAFKKRKFLESWKDEPSNESCQKHGLIVVTSTTGNGDPPENAGRFVRFCKRKTEVAKQPLKHTAFAVLALGDTNYDQFCQTGKVVDKKMQELGGTRAKKLACADEGTGLEDVVEPWVETILEQIVTACRGELVEGEAVSPPTTASLPADNATAAVPADTANVNAKAGKTAEEEKKSDEQIRANPAESSEAPSAAVSKGVVTLTWLCKQQQLQETAKLWEVEDCLLPSLTSRLATCQLIDENDSTLIDKNADVVENEDQLEGRPRGNSIASSVSSSTAGLYYNANRPFDSSILGARYLTVNTAIDAAKECVCNELVKKDKKINGDNDYVDDDYLIAAAKIYDEHFPLCSTTTKDSSNASAAEQQQQKQQYERNGKRVLELTLSLPQDDEGNTLEYQPGDALGLLVPNDAASVQFVLHMLQTRHGISNDQKISLDDATNDNQQQPIPPNNVTTVEQALRWDVDLSSPLVKNNVLNRRLVLTLSNHAADPNEAAALRWLASSQKAAIATWKAYCDQQRVTVVDLLREFPSTQSIPFTALLAILPAITPRYYSVSSSPLTMKQQRSLTVAFSVVDYVTPSLLIGCDAAKEQETVEFGQRRVRGLATRYMEALSSFLLYRDSDTAATQSSPPSNTKLKIFPKPAADFRMPVSLSVPLILIGPGTGVAPFMGFLFHRRALAEQQRTESAAVANTVVEGTWRGGFDFNEQELPATQSDASGLQIGVDFRHQQHVPAKKDEAKLDQLTGSIDLFFGCRHKDHDWLYQEEQKVLLEQGILTNLYTAFSRDSATSDDVNRTKYVQHVLQNDSECAHRVVDLITNRGAAVYICGDGNAMGKDVTAALVEALTRLHCQGNSSEAQDYLEKLKQQKRFLLDIWS